MFALGSVDGLRAVFLRRGAVRGNFEIWPVKYHLLKSFCSQIKHHYYLAIKTLPKQSANMLSDKVALSDLKGIEGRNSSGSMCPSRQQPNHNYPQRMGSRLCLKSREHGWLPISKRFSFFRRLPILNGYERFDFS